MDMGIMDGTVTCRLQDSGYRTNDQKRRAHRQPTIAGIRVSCTLASFKSTLRLCRFGILT